MGANEEQDGKQNELEKKKSEFKFCTEGHCCQDRLKQPEIPSDNSCMPEEELEAVEEDIDRANQLLLQLGLEDPERNRVIKEAFRGIEGLIVTIELEVGEEEEEGGEEGEAEGDAKNEVAVAKVEREVTGKVFLAGNDFVALLQDETEILIPNEMVSLIKAEGRYAEPVSEPQLSEIDPCFRRELTFHFGRTVSSSPELIQIFFGMKLAIYLLLIQDKEIQVVLEEETLEGVLWKVSEDSLTLKNGQEEKDINLAHVLYIKFDRESEKEYEKEK
ncbi:hypothetical protein [Bacillus sp. SG-1]|uniref:hypothetical protein n=1 Tax=Bacillus sp. SG-1 TaxID=161544 RepID=UPI0001544BC6|nr:hypothetical protein [Bacillus sp. SG-1]EDL64245.1 hypothetical protein BSG1_00160 [Bacillus sp. SG-1]